ncbi:MAG: FG-GAP-like repeat-containing protein [Bacteroidia bacterium]|nr:FG-GAP-like repeat-containing protein [Bacteroidia bacterium]
MNRFLLLLLFAYPLYANCQISFSDQADRLGLGELGPNYGVAIADYDKDGWEDIYLTRRPGANRLFKNIGGSFVDVANSAGVDASVDTKIALWADFDNDGWLDLFLANRKGVDDMLYKNNGDGSFSDVSIQAGIQHKGDPFAAITGDVDNDGYLDIYIAHFGGQNVLWRNNGNMTFTDITVQAGATSNLIAMGATFVDFDKDGDLDIYLTHDGYGPNIMYSNDGKGNFIDVAPGIGADIAAFGMGVDVGDINNDGWPDLYITNLYPNKLLLNKGNGAYQDITDSAGVGDPGMGWGAAFFDADNDGFQDIYFSNTPAYPNILYKNNGDSTFSNISEGTVLSSQRGNGFGLASFDYNKDGRVDILLANSNDTVGVQLFRNDTENDFHWFAVKLNSNRLNNSAIGAKAEIFAGNHYAIDMVSGGSSWAAQHSPQLHFGLKNHTLIDSLVITWPDGEREIHVNLQVDQLFEATQLGNPASIESFDQLVSRLVVRRNQIQLSLRDNTNLSLISVINVSGQLLYQKEIKAAQGKMNHEINTQTWPSGIYVVNISNKDGFQGKKILLKKD